MPMAVRMPMGVCTLGDLYLGASSPVAVVSVVVTIVLISMPMRSRVRISISATHVVSLEPLLHLDKANFASTAPADKRNSPARAS